jgi:hypothetical protein
MDILGENNQFDVDVVSKKDEKIVELKIEKVKKTADAWKHLHQNHSSSISEFTILEDYELFNLMEVQQEINETNDELDEEFNLPLFEI